MFNIYSIIAIFLLYMGLLFLVAYLVESKRIFKSKKLTPYIYSLSFAIYCTAWTYYGSVGKVISGGFLFLAVYLGPTLIMFLWPIILKKMIRIKTLFKITSLADLITIRYNKSALIGAIVSLGALFGTVPYISIQLKALITSIEILQVKNVDASQTEIIISNNVGILIVILMIFFTILFGIRKLDPTERHEGMMAIVAIESLIKLIAIIVVGIFIVFFVMDGLSDILNQADNRNLFNSVMSETNSSYSNWVSILLLSMFAIMFLPRQFHVSIVENSDESHISTVMWVFPLYLLLITFFTIPIAMGGALLNPNAELIDFYILTIPIEQNSAIISILAFIGGFSASTSMIMITAMTMSIMISNYLLLPLIEAYKPLGFLKKRILYLRWVIVAIFISMGYLFYSLISKYNLIVNIGLISFTAILQFAPIIIGGLFWKEANKKGALWGLISGFLIWFYTLILPPFISSGIIDSNIMETGLFNIELLKPNALFGLENFSSIPHAVFWSMVFNISLFVILSLLNNDKNKITKTAHDFVDILLLKEEFHSNENLKNDINLEEKSKLFKTVLSNYFFSDKTNKVLSGLIKDRGLSSRSFINILEYSKLYSDIEKVLTGLIGSAGAHKTLITQKLFTKKESKELSNIYVTMLSEMKITPKEFNEKINFFKEREKMQLKHSNELSEKVNERTKELLEQKEVFETLFNDTTDGFLLIKDNVFIDCNNAALKMLKFKTKKEFLNNINILKISPKYQHDGQLSEEKYKKILKKCLEVGNDRFEWIHIKSTGEYFWVEVVLTKIIINNEDVVHVVWRDIQDKKMLEVEIKKRTYELERSNKELHETIYDLEITQDRLVESEKMASLGGLVAGIAHEINTPVGIGLTGTTHFLEITKKINEDYLSDEMTQEEFEEYLETSKELALLINSNLSKTAQLIKSFKQVAVDQTSESKREFNVKDYINETLLSFHNITRKTNLEIKVDCDDELIINSYAGSFSQIITNFVINSIRHAYNEGEFGEIIITVNKNENEIELLYKDDGKGISELNLPKIFDPFFTTNREKGGTGLGLNIIYNIVTTTLNGRIYCESKINEGVLFKVIIPIT